MVTCYGFKVLVLITDGCVVDKDVTREDVMIRKSSAIEHHSQF